MKLCWHGPSSERREASRCPLRLWQGLADSVLTYTVYLPTCGCPGSRWLQRNWCGIPAGNHYRHSVQPGEFCGAGSVPGLLFLFPLEAMAPLAQVTTSTWPRCLLHGDLNCIHLTLPWIRQMPGFWSQSGTFSEVTWIYSACFLGVEAFVAPPKLVKRPFKPLYHARGKCQACCVAA